MDECALQNLSPEEQRTLIALLAGSAARLKRRCNGFEAIEKIILIRYGWFLLGLAINSFGIALMTKSALGTSQISSIPYVLSLRFEHLSFGMTTFLINMIFVAGEIVLLEKGLSSRSIPADPADPGVQRDHRCEYSGPVVVRPGASGGAPDRSAGGLLDPGRGSGHRIGAQCHRRAGRRHCAGHFADMRPGIRPASRSVST